MKYFLHLLVLLSCISCYAQDAADTIQVPEIVVLTTASTSITYAPDTTLIFSSLPQTDEYLSKKEAGIFIKNYGAASLSSLSANGLPGEQQLIYWNGLKINSVMNGILDLKLLPTGNSESIQFDRANSQSAGGSLQFDNKIDFNNRTAVGVSFVGASFNTIGSRVASSWSNDRNFVGFQILSQSSENDFSYRNRAQIGKPTLKLEHAASRLTAFQISAGHQIKDSTTIKFFAWYQKSERELPATMVENYSLATQNDQHWRQIFSLNKRRGSWQYDLSTAWQWEEIIYSDPQIDLLANNRAHTWTQKAKASFNKNKMRTSLRFRSEYSRARADNYGVAVVTRSILEGKWSFQYAFNAKIKLKAMSEGVYYNNKFYFLPSLSSSFKYLLKNWRFLWKQTARISVGRHFRAPSLNDHYWVPGGNPSLGPETGWKADLNIKGEMQLKGLVFRQELGFFFRDIAHRILWRPGNGFWSPIDAGTVETKGYSIGLNLGNRFYFNRVNWKITGNYSRTIARVKSSDIIGDASIGKQLIYTPEHRLLLSLSTSYREFDLEYHHDFTGSYFISTDNFSEQEAYQLGQLDIKYSLPKKRSKSLGWSFGLSIKNIWDEDYEVLPFRPMPGRSFHLSAKMKFIHKK